ncbi:hypothetical protein WA158_007327 [Blastocystis sp. Blastoise]
MSGNSEDINKVDEAKARALEIAQKLGLSSIGTVKRAASTKFSDDVTKKRVYVPPTAADLNYRIVFNEDLLHKISTETNTILTTAGEYALPMGNEEPFNITITGSDSLSIEKAIANIKAIFEDKDKCNALYKEHCGGVASTSASRTLDLFPTAGEIDDEMSISNSIVGIIIGRGGETIKSLNATLGCQIQLQKNEEVLPGALTRLVKFHGKKENIEGAKKAILTIIQTGSVSVLGMDSNSVAMNVRVEKLRIPNDKVGMVIGKGGITIKSIQQRNSIRIQMPQVPDDDDHTKRTLTLTGPGDNVKTAIQEIMNIVEGQMGFIPNNYPNESIVVPNDKVGLIIGKGGDTLRGIREKTGCNIHIPQVADPNTNPPVRTITISGDPHSIAIARDEISSIIGQIVDNIRPSQPMGYNNPYEPYGMYNAYGGYNAYGANGYASYGMYGQQWPAQATAAPATAAPGATTTATTTAPAATTTATTDTTATTTTAADGQQYTTEQIRQMWITYYVQAGYSQEQSEAAANQIIASSTGNAATTTTNATATTTNAATTATTTNTEVPETKTTDEEAAPGTN